MFGGNVDIIAVTAKPIRVISISKLILRPNYARFGRAAPLKRNEQMVDIADMVIVVWDGVSRGSAHTIRYAEQKGKCVQVVRANK